MPKTEAEIVERIRNKMIELEERGNLTDTIRLNILRGYIDEWHNVIQKLEGGNDGQEG